MLPTPTFFADFFYIPPMPSSAARSEMVSVEPCRMTRCLFLNLLSVRVKVSRVVPTNSAISSCVRGSLICIPVLVCFPWADQSSSRRATFSGAEADRPTVRRGLQRALGARAVAVPEQQVRDGARWMSRFSAANKNRVARSVRRQGEFAVR